VGYRKGRCDKETRREGEKDKKKRKKKQKKKRRPQITGITGFHR
jgi:hypothetical protein